jgi:hypothetical protein
MSNSPVTLTYEYEVDLRPGESFTLPDNLTANLSAGRWLITIQSIADTVEVESALRDHSAFLNSYSSDDEGLYDDYTR